jgi:hypothetical protein
VLQEWSYIITLFFAETTPHRPGMDAAALDRAGPSYFFSPSFFLIINKKLKRGCLFNTAGPAAKAVF